MISIKRCLLSVESLGVIDIECSVKASSTIDTLDHTLLADSQAHHPHYPHAKCDDREVRHHLRHALNELLDLNHTSNILNLVSLLIPKFAKEDAERNWRTLESGH